MNKQDTETFVNLFILVLSFIFFKILIDIIFDELVIKYPVLLDFIIWIVVPIMLVVIGMLIGWLLRK